jgi:GT2 family glycosyltransferase
MQRQPGTAALSCYFHAFDTDASLDRGTFLYTVRPTGGPFVLGATQNIYGDACSLYRVEMLRKLGGFGTERGTSFEDWELFVRMVGAGLRVDVVPDVLFWYRHRTTGFSRVTDGFANHQRVLRAFAQATHLPQNERTWLAQVVAGLEQQRQVRQSRSLGQRMWAWFRGKD